MTHFITLLYASLVWYGQKTFSKKKKKKKFAYILKLTTCQCQLKMGLFGGGRKCTYFLAKNENKETSV